MPFELIAALLLGVVLPCAILIPAHYGHVRETSGYGVIGSILIMLVHYAIGLALIVLMVSFGGCFNRILIPY